MNIRIKKLDDYGRGIAFINGKITFIPNALEDELIEYQLNKEKKKYNEAAALQIFDSHKERIEPVCPYFFLCGGCHLQHMSFSYENAFKIQKVKEILKKFSKIEIDNLQIIAKSSSHYRNKVTFTVDQNKIGLLKAKTNNLIEVDHCDLIHNKLNKVVEVLKVLLTMETDISKIMLRVGNRTNEVMISITGKVKNTTSFLNLADSLIINGNSITQDHITSYIMDKKFQINYCSFFQVNDEIVESLYQEIINIIKNISAQNVLDLYCGVGTIGISICSYVQEVVGVEVVKESVLAANHNKELNKVENISFIHSKVEDIIGKLSNRFDTIIVDPPRSGLDPITKKVLKDLKPNYLLYISCDPITLARDLKELKEIYRIESIKLFNMFPRTYHVESLVLLELNDEKTI